MAFGGTQLGEGAGTAHHVLPGNPAVDQLQLAVREAPCPEELGAPGELEARGALLDDDAADTAFRN